MLTVCGERPTGGRGGWVFVSRRTKAVCRLHVASAHLVVDHEEAQQALGEVLHLQAVAAAAGRQAAAPEPNARGGSAMAVGPRRGQRAVPALDKLVEPHKLFGGLDPAEDHLDVVLDGRLHHCARPRTNTSARRRAASASRARRRAGQPLGCAVPWISSWTALATRRRTCCRRSIFVSAGLPQASASAAAAVGGATALGGTMATMVAAVAALAAPRGWRGECWQRAPTANGRRAQRAPAASAAARGRSPPQRAPF